MIVHNFKFFTSLLPTFTVLALDIQGEYNPYHEPYIAIIAANTIRFTDERYDFKINTAADTVNVYRDGVLTTYAPGSNFLTVFDAISSVFKRYQPGGGGQGSSDFTAGEIVILKAIAANNNID